jgi:sulfate transport system ATP-binding protein
MSIHLRNVSKRYGDFVAVDAVSLEIPEGSLVALLGPSGSGKTTLLRIIAGLEVADAGAVAWRGVDITHHPARDREMGFVFQHYALFRHMTIEDNVGYGLFVRGVDKKERKARVDELLRLVRLEGVGKRYPAQLSGGQRQRIALARALAAQPSVLLLDEPFGALDAKVRQELRQWLRRLHHDIRVTSVFVTHDQEEAFEVADRVVVMNRGRVEQEGAPMEVFEHPKNAFVMDFLGNVNVFQGRVYVRPHELSIARDGAGPGSMPAEILHVTPTGSTVKVELETSDADQPIHAELTAERFAELDLKVGEIVHVAPKKARVFAPGYQI